MKRRTFDLRRVLSPVLVLTSILHGSCGQQSVQNTHEITVAAAANLTDAFAEMAKQFTAKTGIRVVYSFGSTAELTRQIENGGPFDVFAAADVEHIDGLAGKALISPETRAIYARGRLVLWSPDQGGAALTGIQDLTNAEVKTIAIAKPDLAPYGRATVEALKALDLWSQIAPKVVYGSNVSATKQYAMTGNASVAFIPMGLVKEGEGKYIEIDARLHQPINQAIAVVKASPKQDAARNFVNYVIGDEGRALLRQYGYSDPLSE